MTDEELEDILGGEKQIEPSPGFAGAVMRAVRRDAATPPAIRFPWILALPGLMGWGLVLVLAIAVPLYDSGVPATPTLRFRFDIPRMVALVRTLFDASQRFQIGWVALAILLTFVCVRFPLRLIRGSRN